VGVAGQDHRVGRGVGRVEGGELEVEVAQDVEAHAGT
jgi:hypothetical protein